MAEFNNKNNYSRGANAQEKGSNKNAVSASVIGEPFHNPYTFIPFPVEVKRYKPTLLTADERPDEQHRHSGVLELEIKTLAPLMTCGPVAIPERAGRQTFEALTIGNDVVVPSTGIRGSLRTLMTIISGGTLGYMDEDLWLTQGRDAQLGPNQKIPDVPDRAFLAKVVLPGSATHVGVIELGETKLIKAEDLERSIRDLDRKRPTTGRNPLQYDGWDVKLSGRPIMRRGKKEGLFKGSGVTIELAEHFWQTYQGRHRHSVQSELKKGDLIWLEPVNLDCEQIQCAEGIQSIQWSRWGRHGVALKELIPQVVLPDSMRDDGAVDMVTDLFGQIPKINNAAGPFAARIRPGNLVFFDGKDQVYSETLAPLAAPHPGCLAFYRDQENLDLINNRSDLKGYKVYRNTLERGVDAPWKYAVQGVYSEQGRLKLPQEQRVNKTAELLNEGLTGKLRISFRALGDDELALLYAACSVDWKLGGGKPLGLGHCRVVGLKRIDEEGDTTTPMGSSMGENLVLDQSDFKMIEQFKDRIDLYRASQVPVAKLRYPRAVTQNNNKSFRAGLSWFARHASPKKNGQGLETIWTAGALQSKAGGSQIRAQALPNLDVADSDADLLYGYDVVELDVNTSNRNQRIVGKMEKFDIEQHASGDEQAGENTSQNRETRQAIRDRRSSSSAGNYALLTKENIGVTITKEFEQKKITPSRAREILVRLEELGVRPEQSNKWANKFKRLKSIADRE